MNTGGSRTCLRFYWGWDVYHTACVADMLVVTELYKIRVRWLNREVVGVSPLTGPLAPHLHPPAQS